MYLIIYIFCEFYCKTDGLTVIFPYSNATFISFNSWLPLPTYLFIFYNFHFNW